MRADDATTLHAQAVQIVVAMAPRQVEQMSGATRLVEDLGYDSLRLIELGIALEEHFGVAIEDDESIRADTLDDVEQTVARLVRRMAG